MNDRPMGPLEKRLRAWLDEPDETGIERSRRRMRARIKIAGRWHTGGLGYTGKFINVRDSSRGPRSQYQSIYERTLEAENGLQFPGPNGRYVDWREVVPELDGDS